MDDPFADDEPTATATVAVEEDDAAVAVSGGDDAGVDDVTASLQSSRVAEPARPKASGAAGGASTVPRAPGNIPFFEVSLTDWAKRGEGMNAYVVYTVVTKTSSTEFKSPTSTVQRRFNHFVWLYEQLTNAYPGVIVPPIPEKQAMGRFDADFLSGRKIALERCLRRMVAHPILHQSSDLKLFLEEDNLEAAMTKKKDLKKALLGGMASVISQTAGQFSKSAEKDEFFESRRVQLESFEKQLKLLLTAVESMIKSRKELAASLGEFGVSIKSLGSSDSNEPLSSALTQLGDVQSKLKDIQLAQRERTQAVSDEVDFASVVDEYIRIISSIRVAMANRNKLIAAKDAAAASVIKKREALEKARGDAKKASKIPAMEAEVEEAEATERRLTQEAEDCTAQLKQEFERFDEDKVADFQRSAADFVNSMVQSQQKIIEVWTAYLPEVQRLPAAENASA